MVHPHVVCCHRQIRKWELFNVASVVGKTKKRTFMLLWLITQKKSKTNSEHVRVLTEKWQEMALNVNNQILLNRPAFGVVSNKLFYHSSCYKSLEYENDRILKENDDNDSESWAKAFALNKVVTYLYDENEKSPRQIFSVNILEKKISMNWPSMESMQLLMSQGLLSS